MRVSLVLAFAFGLLCGIAGLLAGQLLFSAVTQPAAETQHLDPRASGLPWGWLAFGYTAQALFMGRMLVQWVATEKKKASVVPVLFWWLSLFGGTMLTLYFLRRGDPVGLVGQIFGVVVYTRNLILIARQPRQAAEPEV